MVHKWSTDGAVLGLLCSGEGIGMLNAGVPDWSGEFYEIGDEGVMAVSIRDHEHHRPPQGWTLVDIHETPTGAYEIFEYARAK